MKEFSMEGQTINMMSDVQVQKLAEEIFERCWAKFREEHPAEKEALRPADYWCEHLRINRSTLWRWCRDGRVVATKLGGKLFFKASDFENINKNN